jgi:hypothetical protein
VISDKAFNSEQRKSVTCSGSFRKITFNHLYTIGNKICEENQVPFDILKPLILETAHKIMTISPNEAQTGPAKETI